MGRDEEIGLLRRYWDQLQEGVGHVVLLSGEAGLGKSSLVNGLRTDVSQAGARALTLRCSSYARTSTFHPIIAYAQRALGWQSNDRADTKLAKLESNLQDRCLPLPKLVPLIASLLSLPLPEDDYPPLTLTPQQQRQQILEALVSLLVEDAEWQPTLLVWEDIHWADPSSVELLELLIEQVPTVSMLIVLTYRPEFDAPWPARSHVTPIPLSRLERRQVERLIAHVASDKNLPSELVEYIVSKTDGVPLFAEELAKSLLESDLLAADVEGYELRGALASATIPATLQDSLMARLDRLLTAREVAQLAAVLGRDFTYDIIRAITPLDEEQLQQGLDELVGAELLFQRGRPPQSRYVFKHALIQDVAYDSLLRSRRQQVPSSGCRAFDLSLSRDRGQPT